MVSDALEAAAEKRTAWAMRTDAVKLADPESDDESELLSESDELLSESEELLSESDELLSEDEELLESDELLSESEELLSESDELLSEDEELLESEELLSEDEELLLESDELLSEDEELLLESEDELPKPEEELLELAADPKSTAMAPTASASASIPALGAGELLEDEVAIGETAYWSSGVQVVPPSGENQTPPLADPA